MLAAWMPASRQGLPESSRPSRLAVADWHQWQQWPIGPKGLLVKGLKLVAVVLEPAASPPLGQAVERSQLVGGWAGMA